MKMKFLNSVEEKDNKILFSRRLNGKDDFWRIESRYFS